VFLVLGSEGKAAMSSLSNAAFSGSTASNEDDLKGLNARLKSQFAAEFIQMMTEAQESECFARCFRKPGTAMDKAEEVELRQLPVPGIAC
jgi:hypothetical protein